MSVVFVVRFAICQNVHRWEQQFQSKVDFPRSRNCLDDFHLMYRLMQNKKNHSSSETKIQLLIHSYTRYCELNLNWCKIYTQFSHISNWLKFIQWRSVVIWSELNICFLFCINQYKTDSFVSVFRISENCPKSIMASTFSFASMRLIQKTVKWIFSMAQSHILLINCPRRLTTKKVNSCNHKVTVITQKHVEKYYRRCGDCK